MSALPVAAMALCLVSLVGVRVRAQDTTSRAPKPVVAPTVPSAGTSATTSSPAPWYTKISIRGYGQIRYNRLLETNELLQCEQCDRSWGTQGGVFIRRARVILFGQIHPRVYIYLQPDFGSTAGTTGIGHISQKGLP